MARFSLGEWNAKKRQRQCKADAEKRATQKREDNMQIIGALNALADEQKTARGQKEKSEKSKNLREWLTVAIVAIAAIFSWGQWRVMSDQTVVTKAQLEEMKASGIQMEAAIQAIQNSAQATSDSAVATGKTADATSAANALNKASSDYARRAWIAPNFIESTAPTLNTELSVKMWYSNVGREPALNAYSDIRPFKFSQGGEFNGVNQKTLDSYLQECEAGKGTDKVGAIYPSTKNSYYIAAVIPKNFIDQDIIDGNKSLLIAGCLVYQTINAIHHSSYCYYFNGKSSLPDRWNFCLVGNEAD